MLETAKEMNAIEGKESAASLLLVDDDDVFLKRLGRAMEKRGFTILLAASIARAKELIKKQPPQYAVVDLRLNDGDGLELINHMKEESPLTRAIIHTGYGNIATAVSAVKMGAVDYLPKPADADEIVSVLLGQKEPVPSPPEKPMSANRVRWEHIQRVYEQCDQNVSQTARELGMHRRTLQRILSKKAPK